MTQDQTNELAREAGFKQRHNSQNEWWMLTPAIAKFAALVAQHEREQCALVCENEKLLDPIDREDMAYDTAIEHCAAAIRARSEK